MRPARTLVTSYRIDITVQWFIDGDGGERIEDTEAEVDGALGDRIRHSSMASDHRSARAPSENCAKTSRGLIAADDASLTQMVEKHDDRRASNPF